METLFAGIAGVAIIFLYVHGKVTKAIAMPSTSNTPAPSNAEGGGEMSPQAPPLQANTSAVPRIINSQVAVTPSSTPAASLGVAGFVASPADNTNSSAGTIGPARPFAHQDIPSSIAILGNPALNAPSAVGVAGPSSFGGVTAPSAPALVSAPPPALLRPIMSGNNGGTTLAPAAFPPVPIARPPVLHIAPGNVNLAAPPPPAIIARPANPPPPLIQRLPVLLGNQVRPVRNNPPPVLPRA